MRYLPANIRDLKSKIKLLKKYIDILAEDRDRPTVRPAPGLTELQSAIAVAFGFHSWAELVSATQSRSTRVSDDLKTFSQLSEMARRFAEKIGESHHVALGLLLRVGLFPGDGTTHVTPGLSLRDHFRFADLVVERCFELKPNSQEATYLRDYLAMIYGHLRDLLPVRELRGGWVAHALTDGVPSIIKGYDRQRGYGLLQRLVEHISYSKKVLESDIRPPAIDTWTARSTFAEIARSLPASGLFVLTGGFATGRTYSAFALSAALRERGGARFPIAYSAGFDRSEPGIHAPIYLGEVNGLADIAPALNLARSSLVFVELAAGHPTTALARTEQRIRGFFRPDRADAWIERHLIGGINHEFGDCFMKNQQITVWKTSNLKQIHGNGQVFLSAEECGDVYRAVRHTTCGLHYGNSTVNPSEPWFRNAQGLVHDGRKTFLTVISEIITEERWSTMKSEPDVVSKIVDLVVDAFEGETVPGWRGGNVREIAEREVAFHVGRLAQISDVHYPGYPRPSAFLHATKGTGGNLESGTSGVTLTDNKDWTNRV